jgi:hypothetical protein
MGEVGIWQLKKGQASDDIPSMSTTTTTTTTVYEEIEGIEAFNIAVSTIGEMNNASSSSFSSIDLGPQQPHHMFDGYQIPPVPLTDEPHNLEPFCRLETVRTSWVLVRPNDSIDDNNESDCNTLTIDLDKTDTGHTVGEVEMVVNTNEEVPKAKVHIRRVIDQILQGYNVDATQQQPMGKLEHFLQNHRRWHYDACIQNGVLK